MKKNIFDYIAKSRHKAIADINHDIDGYDVLLADGWVWDDSYTFFISPTIADLRRDQQGIKFDPRTWEELVNETYYG